MHTRVFRPEQDFPAYVDFLNVTLSEQEDEIRDAYKALGFKETEYKMGYQLKLTR